jgi:predicted membrane protein
MVPGPKRRPYGATVAGAVLVVVGGLWLFDAIDVIDLRVAFVLPAVLAVIGLALIIGAFDGPHAGLVVAGIFVSIAALAVAAAPPDAFHGGIGERDIRVTDQANLAARYDVGLGELSLDLSDLTMTESAEIDVTVGAGELTILLPPTIPVDIDASAGAGQIDLLGETGDGISVNRTYTSDGFDSATVRLTLDLDVAAGNITVER